MIDKIITIVRVYLNEGHGQVDEILEFLHGTLEVKGVTVFRGSAGFGDSGILHKASLIDTALDLPVVIEFFDDPHTANKAVELINERLTHGHIIHWDAVSSQ